MRQARPPKDIPPPLELECLKALWEIREGNVRAVQLQMEPRRKLAYTTVMTLLERLAKKGAVARRKSGRAFLYSPVVDQETLRKKAIQELIDSLFDGAPHVLLKYLQPGSEPVHVIAPQAEERLDAALL
jgi:predicted transcriptional regulator